MTSKPPTVSKIIYQAGKQALDIRAIFQTGSSEKAHIRTMKICMATEKKPNYFVRYGEWAYISQRFAWSNCNKTINRAKVKLHYF